MLGELAVFETEHLCRWVKSMMPRLVADTAWQMCRGQLETPNRPAMGVSVDPSGKRASAALAWKQSDGSIGLLVSAEVTGNPINVIDLAVDLTAQAQTAGVQVVAYDPWTDEHLARHFPNTEKINGSEFANASERFVRAVETQGLRWQQADSISADLPYVARKAASGHTWMADRADPDRSITAALAAIRAVWMASNPQVQIPSAFTDPICRDFPLHVVVFLLDLQLVKFLKSQHLHTRDIDSFTDYPGLTEQLLAIQGITSAPPPLHHLRSDRLWRHQPSSEP